MTLVAILTIRKDALEAFRAFERHAATVMADHGGRIERTVVVAPAATPDLVKKIHVVTFPDARAFICARRRSWPPRSSRARTGRATTSDP